METESSPFNLPQAGKPFPDPLPEVSTPRDRLTETTQGSRVCSLCLQPSTSTLPPPSAVLVPSARSQDSGGLRLRNLLWQLLKDKPPVAVSHGRRMPRRGKWPVRVGDLPGFQGGDRSHPGNRFWEKPSSFDKWPWTIRVPNSCFPVVSWKSTGSSISQPLVTTLLQGSNCECFSPLNPGSEA